MLTNNRSINLLNKLPIALLASAILSVYSSVAIADDSQSSHLNKVLSCTQDGVVIFEHDKADIKEFDPSQHGASLTQKMKLKDAKLHLYIFSPGRIVCIIDADKDKSKNKPA